METIVVADHRNHHEYYSRNCGLSKFGSFSSPFSGINCRTFHSGAGLLPTPPKLGFSGSFSPRTPSQSLSRNRHNSKRIVKSHTLPIPIKINFDRDERFLNDNICFSERWAGPAYSSSPPASSLPMPKFSLQPKRTKSLDLATDGNEIDLNLTAKSAPVSPTWEQERSSLDLFGSADAATETLRRILNLDV